MKKYKDMDIQERKNFGTKFLVAGMICLIIGAALNCYKYLIVEPNKPKPVKVVSTLPQDMDKVSKQLNKTLSDYLSSVYDPTQYSNRNILATSANRMYLVNTTLTTSKTAKDSPDGTYKYVTLKEYTNKYKELFGTDTYLEYDLEEAYTAKSMVDQQISPKVVGLMMPPVAGVKRTLTATSVKDSLTSANRVIIGTYEDNQLGAVTDNGTFELVYGTIDDNNYIVSLTLKQQVKQP